MKKIVLLCVLIMGTIVLTACDGITEEEANVILADTLDSLSGSKTSVFEARDPYHNKLVVLHAEEYFDTLLLEYNTGNYDYRYMRYIEAKRNADDEQLYYPVYFECTVTPSCDQYNMVNQTDLDSMDEESLYKFGERDYYVYLKGHDSYFDFYKFIDVASGVITYAETDTDGNVIIDNLTSTVFTGMLLEEEISIETYTFEVTVSLEQLQMYAPDVLRALYFIDDVAGFDLTGITQKITLEVTRDTNELVTFYFDQRFEHIDQSVTLPSFTRDYHFEIVLYKNGQEAIDYIDEQPTLVPIEVAVN